VISGDLEGVPISVLLDSGNTFADAITDGTLKQLQSQNPQLTFKKYQLKQSYQVGSASGHFMNVTHAVDTTIGLYAEAGLLVFVPITLYIIPGSHIHPVNLGYQTLIRLGLIDFASTLRSLPQRYPSVTKKPMKPSVYVPIVASIRENQVAVQKILNKNFTKPYYAQKPDMYFPGHRPDDLFDDDIDSFEKENSVEFSFDPTDCPFRSEQDEHNYVVAGLKKKLAEIHPSSNNPNGCIPSLEIWEELSDFLLTHPQVWRDGLGDQPPCLLPPYDLETRVDLNVPPIDQKVRPLDPKRQQFESMLLKVLTTKSPYKPDHVPYFIPFNFGMVVPGSRAHISPVNYVDKNPVSSVADVSLNTYRPTSDLRQVNLTIKHPLIFPTLTEAQMQQIAGCEIFSCLDIDNCYYQYELTEYTRTWLLHAFSTGVFMPTRATQGTKDVGAHVQSCHTSLIAPYRDHMKVQIDDFLIHSDNNLRKWLDLFKSFILLCVQFKIMLALKKAIFFTYRVTFNGRIFDKDGMTLHPKFYRDTKKLKELVTADDLSSFLGAMRWVSRCIPYFAQISAPLQELLTHICETIQPNYIRSARRKAILTHHTLTDYGFNATHREAYHTVLQALQEKVRLAFRDATKTLISITDANQTGYGIFVSQVSKLDSRVDLRDHFHEPLAILSGLFNSRQLKWSMPEKEAFAIQVLLVKCNHLLMEHFHLFTDAEILAFLFRTDELRLKKPTTERLARIAANVQSRNVSVWHVEGLKNEFTDHYSRHTSDVELALKEVASFSSIYYLRLFSLSSSHYYHDFTTDLALADTLLPMWTINSLSITSNETEEILLLSDTYISIEELTLLGDDSDDDDSPSPSSIMAITRRQAKNTQVSPSPAPDNTVDRTIDTAPATSVIPPETVSVPTPLVVPNPNPPAANTSPVVAVPNDSDEYLLPGYNEVLLHHQMPLNSEIMLSQQSILSLGTPTSDFLYLNGEPQIDSNGLVTVLFNENRVFWIPVVDLALRLRFMILAHDGAGGHFDETTTVNKILMYAAWYKCDKEISDFVNICLHCKRNKGGRIKQRPYGMLLQGSKPFEVLYLDFLYIGPSKPYDGVIYKYVLIIKDSWSGYARFFKATTCDATAAARGLMRWLTDYQRWDSLVSDNASHFKNDITIELNRLLKAKHHFVVPYTPHSVGIEHVCHLFLVVLRCLMGEKLDVFEHWIDYLEIIEMLMNERPDPSRGGYSHKELMLGIKPSNPIEFAFNSVWFSRFKNLRETLHSPTFKEHMDKLYADLSDSRAIATSVWIKRKKAQMDRQLGKPGVFPANFDLGDFVLVAHVNIDNRLNKLMANWKGPYRIVRIDNDWVYDVEDLRSWPNEGKVTTHHAIRLKFYAHSTALDVNEELRKQSEYSISMFKVSSIKKHRYNKESNIYEVLVRWYGLTHVESTWNPLSTIYAHSPLTCEEYFQTLPTAEAHNLRSKLREN
jgi:hypothetical protein